MSKEHIYEAGKSFWVYANSKESGCFNCGYCVLLSVDHLTDDGTMAGFRDLEIGAPPGQIDHRMINIPVAVNNAFGDPTIQWQDTLARLEKLGEYEHQGVVALITKGTLSEQRVRELERYSPLNLVVFQSVSGLQLPIEPANYHQRINNIKLLRTTDIPVVSYLRPIIPGFNDSEEIVAQVLDDIAEAGAQILCYAGLMGREEVIAQLEKVIDRELPPPEGFTQWEQDKKLIRKGLRPFIETRTKENGMEIYRKTSCAASMAAGKPYDYNLHMFRPDKYNCCECKNTEGCIGAKDRLEQPRIEATLEVLKTDGQVHQVEQDTIYPLREVYQHSLPTCITSEKYRLVLHGEHTLGEVALAKWMSGVPVSAERLVDTTQIPDLWDIK